MRSYVKNTHLAVKGTLKGPLSVLHKVTPEIREPILTPSMSKPCSLVSDSTSVSLDGIYSMKYSNISLFRRVRDQSTGESRKSTKVEA